MMLTAATAVGGEGWEEAGGEWGKKAVRKEGEMGVRVPAGLQEKVSRRERLAEELGRAQGGPR